jgi:hypothetical protein
MLADLILVRSGEGERKFTDGGDGCDEVGVVCD